MARGSGQWHCPPMQVVTPGHWALVWQPGTQTPPWQMSPDPSLPGLQSPSPAHGVPPPLLLELLELDPSGVQHSIAAGPGQKPGVET
jgi:hypothetical protein